MCLDSSNSKPQEITQGSLNQGSSFQFNFKTSLFCPLVAQVLPSFKSIKNKKTRLKEEWRWQQRREPPENYVMTLCSLLVFFLML